MALETNAPPPLTTHPLMAEVMIYFHIFWEPFPNNISTKQITNIKNFYITPDSKYVAPMFLEFPNSPLMQL